MLGAGIVLLASCSCSLALLFRRATSARRTSDEFSSYLEYGWSPTHTKIDSVKSLHVITPYVFLFLNTRSG